MSSKNLTKKRKAITLEQKLDVVIRYERGEKTKDITVETGFSESTLRTIRNNSEKIKGACKNSIRMNSARVSVIRPQIMEKMERLLSAWIEYLNQENVAVSIQIIKEKAINIYESLKIDEPDAKPFIASNGWFQKFKDRHGSYSLKLTGEIAAADTETANHFPQCIKEIITDGNYEPRQVFSLHGTGLFWKRIPGRTFISVEDNFAPGFKDRCTILLGSNAAGDLKLKPLMVYHSETPRAFKGISKAELPVYWKGNEKGWVSSALFHDYFANLLIPELKKYCEKEHIPFKILIIIDNALGHPQIVKNINKNVEVVFLPPDTSLIQPLDQGVIKAFKSYYLRRTFKKIIREVDSKEKVNIIQFWKSFNIRMAIDIIAESWDEVSKNCLNGAWKKIWPEAVGTPDEDVLTTTTSVINDIVNYAKTIGLQEVNQENVEELLESQTPELTNKELVELLDSEKNEDNIEVIRPEKSLTVDGMVKAIDNLECYLSYFIENDPDEERSAKVSRLVKQANACYDEILYKKQHSISDQTTLENFKPTTSKSAQVTQHVVDGSSDEDDPNT